MTFALAMVENPHVWKHAQVEIDAVVGTDRLPEFDDRPSLPYVDAIVREVFRWRPVFPSGACCDMDVLSKIFLNILEVARTRLPEMISTGGTSYPKVCLICVRYLHVVTSFPLGAIIVVNAWYANRARASISAGPLTIPVGPSHATELGIPMGTNSFLKGSWMRKGC